MRSVGSASLALPPRSAVCVSQSVTTTAGSEPLRATCPDKERERERAEWNTRKRERGRESQRAVRVRERERAVVVSWKMVTDGRKHAMWSGDQEGDEEGER